MARTPEFSNLGVTDPTTGRPVYLSANEIATVLGATGGVAPSNFQAAVEGGFKGIDKGVGYIESYSNIQAQQARVDYNKAQTESQEIQNDIARQTKDAQILAQNSQIKQKGIEAQIQTEKLTNDNLVLDAIRSGDAAKLSEVISNPKTLLSSLEQDQLIQASYSQLKAQNAFTPVQLSAFDKYNLTKGIYKQGPLQEQYQTAAAAVTGTLPFQQLQAMSGLDTNTLLSQIKVEQGNTEWGPMPVLKAGNSVVALDPKSKDSEYDAFRGFFSTRDRIQTAGKYELPLKPPEKTSKATSEAAPAIEGQASAQEAASSVAALPPAAQETPVAPSASPTVSSGTPVPQVPQTPQTANPNALSPLGVPLRTNTPQLGALNQKTTPSGVPLQTALTKTAQQIFASAPPGTMTISQAYEVAARLTLTKAPLTSAAAEAVSTNLNLADQKINMAQEIRQLVRDAQEADYPLGPNIGQTIGRSIEGAEAVLSPAKDTQIGDIKSKIASLEGRHVILSMQASGMGTKAFDSNKEGERLAKTGPTIYATPKELEQVAVRYEAEAKQVQNETTLAQLFDTTGMSVEQSKKLVSDYLRDNKIRIFDEATGTFVINKNVEEPLVWGYRQLGIDINAEAQNAFSTPTKLPSATPTPQAPGSTTATPFAPAQKTTPSPFPTPKPTASTRGVNYNSTPITMKDVNAIAETVTKGGNLGQFQTAGGVPIKLDKATPDLVARVIGAESLPGKTKGSVRPTSVSPTGVEDAMQVTEATFKEMVATPDPELQSAGTDRTDPIQSVTQGTKYLNKQLKKYDGNVDLALAAYNAGPGAVDKALTQAKVSPARATIDQIAPYLPKSQDTGAYVKKITSRGRVTPQSESPDSGGFFSAKNLENLNPFKIASAEAQTLSVNPTLPNGTPSPTTDTVLKTPDLESGPRGDTPALSEIQHAISNPTGHAVGKAVKWLRNSPVGKLLSEVRDSTTGQSFESFANAATFGLYDEGLGEIETAIGGDGQLMKKEVRNTLKDFRETNPSLAFATDILGSVAGGSGSLLLLKALRGGAGVASTIRNFKKTGTAIAPMTVKEGVKLGAAQGGARGFGEGEGALDSVVKAGLGATVGAVTGGLAGGASKIPVIGNPAVIGAGVGAVAGGSGVIPGVEGGPGGAIVGSGLGAAGATGTAVAAKYSPLAQKAIARAATMLNNFEGTKVLGSMLQKALTSKTPAEAANSMEPAEAYVGTLLKHAPRGDLKNLVIDIGDTQKQTPGIPTGLVDLIKQAEPKTLIKVISQIADEPATASKVNQFLGDRASGQQSRLQSSLGTFDDIATTAQTTVDILKAAQKGTREEVFDATRPLYQKAEAATPRFNSKKIDELLTTPTLKQAVNEARADLEKPLTEKQLAQKVVDRVKRGMTVDELLDPNKQAIPDNDFNLLRLAKNKLDNQIDDTKNNALKRNIGDVKRELEIEMDRLNPTELVAADAEFAKLMSQSDVLRSDAMKVITGLSEGEGIESALPKLMRLTPESLKQVTGILTSKAETAQQNSAILKDAAKKYLLGKFKNAAASKEVASKLISTGEKTNLKTLLGEQEFKKLMTTVDAESRVARSTKSLTGGSDSIPKAAGVEKLNELTGGSEEPFNVLASVTSGSVKSTLANTMKIFLRSFSRERDPVKVSELADTLLLNLPKGRKAVENVLKQRGMKAAELRAIRPHIKEWQALLQGGGQGISTSLEGQALADNTQDE